MVSFIDDCVDLTTFDPRLYHLVMQNYFPSIVPDQCTIERLCGITHYTIRDLDREVIQHFMRSLPDEFVCELRLPFTNKLVAFYMPVPNL